MEGPHAGPGVRIVWQQTTAKSTTEATSVTLSPDGARLAVAFGTRVLLYDTGVVAEPSSSLLATLKAHKDATVTSIDWSGDGQRFVSGSDDGKVVVWSSTGQGLLKYGHHAAFGPVLQVAHEPCPPHRLCSITARDVAIWTPGTKAVRKERLGKEDDDGAAALTCVAWSPEGRHLAVAFADGSISLFEVSSNSSLLEQRECIEWQDEQGKDAVFSMAWTGGDTLVVGRGGGVLTIHRSVMTAPHTWPETVQLSNSLIQLQQVPGQDAVLIVGDDGSLTTYNLAENGARQRVLMPASPNADAITAAATASCARGLVASATRDGRLLLLSVKTLGIIDREEDEGKEEPSVGEEAAAPSSAPKSPRIALEALMAVGRWEEALALAASAAVPAGTAAEARRRQARWHLGRQEWRAAVDALIAAGEHLRAVAVVGARVVGREDDGSNETSGRWWPARIMELARSVNDNEMGGREVARACARLLAAHDGDEEDKEGRAFVREVFLRLGDVTALLDHLTRRQRWFEVGAIARERPGQFDVAALVPYAGWLAAERGRVDEAVATLWAAGGVVEARRLLRALIDNAVVEGRFRDASYGHWVLAVDALQQQQPQPQQHFMEHSALADLYAAYQHVHAHIRQPFTALTPHTLLQAASCVLHSLSSPSQPQPPPGVSTAATLYVLATQADRLGAYGTARQAYDALVSLHLPRAWRDAVGVRRLELRACSGSGDDAVQDPPELLPLCYRCGLRGPLLTPPGADDRCQGCGHPFVRSMLTFEVLPLVEFAPDPAEVATATEALTLLRAGVGDADGDGVNEEDGEGARRFNAAVARTLAAHQQQQEHQSPVKSKGRRQSGSSSTSSTPPPQYTPVMLGARDLQSLRQEEVFVVQAHSVSSGAHELLSKQPPSLAPALLPSGRYYRNVLHPDVPLVLSQAAGRFCGEEAFEAAWLLTQEQEGTGERGEREAGEGGEKDRGLRARSVSPACPFSRVRSVGDCGSV